MKQRILTAALALALAAGFAGPVRAELVTLDFAYSGGAYGNDARATGAITLDLPNLDYITQPGEPFPEIRLPSPAVTDLTMTVTGASAGNGTFTLRHFYSFWLSSPAPLDFTRQLVGQPLGNGYSFGLTSSDCTKGSGPCGDFNFISWKDFPEGVPPDAADFFQVYTQGLEKMGLVSLGPRTAPVPEPGTLALAGLAFGGLAARRRRRAGTA